MHGEGDCSGTGARSILAQDDVEYPVKAILDPPMTPIDGQQVAGVRFARSEAGDEKRGFVRLFGRATDGAIDATDLHD